jgi:hypothetical protein
MKNRYLVKIPSASKKFCGFNVIVEAHSLQELQILLT